MIPTHVLKAFSLEGKGKKLTGGQGRSYLYQDKVIKPVDNEAYYEYITEIWQELNPIAYRISKNCKNDHGKYVYEGYMVSYFEPGSECDDLIEEKLEISRLLHKDLKALNVQSLPPSDDPWTKANQVLWHGASLPVDWDEKKLNSCHSLVSALEPLDEPYQLIHNDLGGNILFYPQLKPLVIDFSPAIAPVYYAEAVMVCDSIAWAGLPLTTLQVLKPLQLYQPYILYAIAFRLLTIAFSKQYTEKRFLEEWMGYEPIWQHIQNL